MQCFICTEVCNIVYSTCPKFGRSALISECYNNALMTEFVATPDILKCHHSQADTISKLTIHSKFSQTFFIRFKMKDFNLTGKCPILGHFTQLFATTEDQDQDPRPLCWIWVQVVHWINYIAWFRKAAKSFFLSQ